MNYSQHSFSKVFKLILVLKKFVGNKFFRGVQTVRTKTKNHKKQKPKNLNRKTDLFLVWFYGFFSF